MIKLPFLKCRWRERHVGSQFAGHWEHAERQMFDEHGGCKAFWEASARGPRCLTVVGALTDSSHVGKAHMSTLEVEGSVSPTLEAGSFGACGADSPPNTHFLFVSHTGTHRPLPASPLHTNIWDLCQYSKRSFSKRRPQLLAWPLAYVPRSEWAGRRRAQAGSRYKGSSRDSVPSFASCFVM